MNARIKSTATLPPCNLGRGNPNFFGMVACQDWREVLAPVQEPRHPEQKRNELFLCNVTRAEFAWLASKAVRKEDFKSFRLGLASAGTTGPVGQGIVALYPMFGALKRGARLRRKETKISKRKRKVNENEQTDKKTEGS